MATAKLVPMEAVCDFAILDVETMDPPASVMEQIEADVRREFEEEWEAPENYKDPEKIAAKKAADLEKKIAGKRKKAALLDVAPVAMCGVMLQSETFLLHGLKKEKAKWFGKNGRAHRVVLEGFHGEKELMEGIAGVLGKKTDAQTMLIGHNVYGFDFPKVRLATVRNGLEVLEALRVPLLENDEKQRAFDTMRHYCRYFGRSGQLFIKQDEMLRNLGLTSLLSGIADGSMVPKLLAAGKVSEVATKLLADLVGVREAFIKMTGRTR